MAQSTPLVQRVLAASVNLSLSAGAIIREVYKSGLLEVTDKGTNDLQTQADRRVQRYVMATLQMQFPNVTIIGEEGPMSKTPIWISKNQDPEVLAGVCPSEYASCDIEDIVVWLDPLDGTTEYTQGLLEHVTLLIGIAVRGKAVAGVIHQPYVKTKEGKLGRTLWGLVGMGVGGFEPLAPSPDRFVLTTSRSHSDRLVELALDALHPDKVIKVGGAGHKVVLLLEGKASAYVFASKGCKKWDTCAPEAILSAAGGKLTDVHGNHYSYEQTTNIVDIGGVFATAKGVDHDKLLSQLPQEVRDTLV